MANRYDSHPGDTSYFACYWRESNVSPLNFSLWISICRSNLTYGNHFLKDGEKLNVYVNICVQVPRQKHVLQAPAHLWFTQLSLGCVSWTGQISRCIFLFFTLMPKDPVPYNLPQQIHFLSPFQYSPSSWGPLQSLPLHCQEDKNEACSKRK